MRGGEGLCVWWIYGLLSACKVPLGVGGVWKALLNLLQKIINSILNRMENTHITKNPGLPQVK